MTKLLQMKINTCGECEYIDYYFDSNYYCHYDKANPRILFNGNKHKTTQDIGMDKDCPLPDYKESTDE